MKPDLYIRADGSARIGLGHIFRCLSLCHILKNNFRISFFSKTIPVDFEKELALQNIDFFRVEDENSFLDQLSPGKIVVLDGYNFDSGYQKKIKKRGCQLVCIDDLHDKEFYADLIINHAPGVLKSDYKANPDTIFALGLEYALLRPAFFEISENNKIQKSPGTILICFGGSDIRNLTKSTLSVVLHYNNFKKIIIITGSSYNHKAELEKLLHVESKVVHYHALQENKMAEVMAGAETAIVPASGILYEALAAGNTAISGTYVENQKNVYTGFKKLNAFIDAGTFKENEIKQALENLKSFKKQNLIDGKSPERIRDLFRALVK